MLRSALATMFAFGAHFLLSIHLGCHSSLRCSGGSPEWLARYASSSSSHQAVRHLTSPIRLGHADLQTTMRHYVLAEEETQREAVEALAEVFGV